MTTALQRLRQNHRHRLEIGDLRGYNFGPTSSQSNGYTWRVMTSAVCLLSTERQSKNFSIRDFKYTLLSPSLAT